MRSRGLYRNAVPYFGGLIIILSLLWILFIQEIEAEEREGVL
jgi:hypothetical protein